MDPDAATLPPPLALYQIATGHYFSQALYVAASLGIADLLAGGPSDNRHSVNPAFEAPINPINLAR